jgi:hypothetical protein
LGFIAHQLATAASNAEHGRQSRSMELSLSVRCISIGDPDDLGAELSSMATDETAYIN